MTDLEQSEWSNNKNDTTRGASNPYAYVNTVARIAVYDDVRSAPRIVEIPPDETIAYIAALTTEIYNQAKALGGHISYTVIKEVAENFIHAQFKEVVVSILDGGETIRFTDRGPGIPDKERVLLPGFSSATSAMKDYIRGVGSGLPIVLEYLELGNGQLTVEDNLGTGSVVTICMKSHSTTSENTPTYTEAPAESAQPTYAPQPSTYAAPQAIPTNPTFQPAPLPVYAQPATPGIANPYSPVPVVYYMMPQTSQVASASTDVPSQKSIHIPSLSAREQEILLLLKKEDSLGITDIYEMTHIPKSSISNLFGKLESAGLVMATKPKGHRMLTDYGLTVAHSL